VPGDREVDVLEHRGERQVGDVAGRLAVAPEVEGEEGPPLVAGERPEGLGLGARAVAAEPVEEDEPTAGIAPIDVGREVTSVAVGDALDGKSRALLER
jgi:hypothetical protein